MRSGPGATIVAASAVGMVAAALLVSGCSSSGSPGSQSAGVRVVASTSVYGDIAATIAGGAVGHGVQITSIIDSPNADPHSYDADTRNQLAISKADVIIENGGGYDDFVDTMRKSAHTDAAVINAVDISGKKAAAGNDLNEHIWYDFPTIAKVASAIEAQLSAKDPSDAATFRANTARFTKSLAGLESGEASIRATHAGTGVAITEPVPLYLLEACGLVNRTPKAFSKAIEDGTDVAPAVLHQTLNLFESRNVSLLAYNEQTTGPQTERVLAAAKTNHIAIVPVTETLPDKTSYLTWMRDNLAAVRNALAAP